MRLLMYGSFHIHMSTINASLSVRKRVNKTKRARETEKEKMHE